MNKPLTLKDVADYSDLRISLEDVNLETYVTTDNLLQNKMGKQNAEKMPMQSSNSVTRYDHGDILVANIRPYLKKIWYAKNTGGSSTDVLTFKVKKGYGKKFVYYSLFRDDFFRHMMNSSKGTKMPRGDKNRIMDFPISDFNDTEQKQIAKVLSDLDAKIEVNNKINQELEAMAKTLYDYWFVQFDFPDVEGKPYKSSGGKMVFNKKLKREIPEGWEVDKLSSLLEHNYNSIGKNDNYTQIRYLDTSSLTLNAISETQLIHTASEKVPSRAKRIVNKNDILYSTVRPNLRHYGIIKHPQDSMVASTGFVQLASKTKDLSNDFIYTYLTSEWITQRLHQIAVLSVSSYPSISPSDILELKIPLPKEREKISFANFKFGKIYEKISLNQKENQKLSELRDWLLPMLMNGQITVSKAYEVREEKLNVAAEPGQAYENDKGAIDDLFKAINYDYEIATIQMLTNRRFGFTYGKKYTHKMFSNIELLNTMPKFKDLAFEEKGWGMFSKAIAKTIDNQKLIYLNRLDNGTQVLKVRSSAFKEVLDWTAKAENKEFVSQVNDMLTLYEKPLINKDMNRIELLNTVLECMKVLKTDSLQAVRNKMANWEMQEEYNQTKAEKFTENETLHMIQFVKTSLL